MTEKIYCDLYAKLISSLSKDNDSKLVNYSKDICNQFFEKNINASLNELKDDTCDYENICKILKEKAEFTGGFIFIANLFHKFRSPASNKTHDFSTQNFKSNQKQNDDIIDI